MINDMSRAAHMRIHTTNSADIKNDQYTSKFRTRERRLYGVVSAKSDCTLQSSQMLVDQSTLVIAHSGAKNLAITS